MLHTLVVSCDGDGTPAEYERIRTPARWERLIEFLAKSRELRDAYSPKTRLMTRTVCETEEGPRGPRAACTVRLRARVPRLAELARLEGESVGPDGDGGRRRVAAVVQQRTLFVDYDGTVVACCNHPRARVFGNLKEQKYSVICQGSAAAIRP